MSGDKLPIRATLHDIVNAIMVADVHAELYGEQHPEQIESIQKFLKQIRRAKIELIDTLRPEIKALTKKA